ncbi:HoxN/HupN/NixA family nickel/cobalt transporter [Hippea maritima]|uniref:Nickel/cobalt efflux system n=1 Tax=Hippea maritima (strain ATCC 700847 / DSM 10411 / MH2) TaxID=760142 RepID=F2LWC3_HIPMA|nr:HoxN/HupN/NixA family nickel/cobalt transporter [Hippea maritima]AEA34057.1 high-affinity nickel-transporter [Hippea maritima DSM 10411]
MDNKNAKLLLSFLAIFNIGVWLAFLGVVKLSPSMVSLGALAYFFGLRHAFDADHIAAIDNVTRKLRQDGRKDVGVGLFFSLGHSSVVLIMSIVIVIIVRGFSPTIKSIEDAGGLFGSIVSAGFLTIIGIINLFILKDLYRVFKIYKEKGSLDEQTREMAEELLNRRGLMGRFFGFMYRKIDKSWKMYPLGFLFGLGFDTATEIAILGISAAMAKNSQLPSWGVIMFPLLFTAGMSLMDSLDGLVMMRIYDWAMVDALRKLFFNMVITGASVFVALAIGTIEWIQVISEKLNLNSAFFEFINNLNFEFLGGAVVVLMVFSWVYAFFYYKKHLAKGVAK